MTAQPMIAVISVATSLGIGKTTRSDAKAYSAHVAAECKTSFPCQIAMDWARSFKACATSGCEVVELSRSTHVVMTWAFGSKRAKTKETRCPMSPKCLQRGVES